ncbi:hypothetical protein ACFT6Z_36075, partial [Streptomyces sp. NPDC057131]|uniref:hypothetical protein n=1 Tax=Streptomyces sp. NPDC057131 TaxID=3346027 RepID=UPI003636E3E0
DKKSLGKIVVLLNELNIVRQKNFTRSIYLIKNPQPLRDFCKNKSLKTVLSEIILVPLYHNGKIKLLNKI